MTAIKQLEDALPDLPKLARRLLNAGYSHGMADQTPYKSNDYYSKADDKSQEALKNLLTAIAAQDAEIARLTKCLAAANSNTEEFERKWYLLGDEIARLREALDHLVDFCDESDSACYGTLSTSFVRNFVDALAINPKGAA